MVCFDNGQTNFVAGVTFKLGILFTGGGLSLLPNTTYFQTAQYIYNMTGET